jgi:hypothetical protein
MRVNRLGWIVSSSAPANCANETSSNRQAAWARITKPKDRGFLAREFELVMRATVGNATPVPSGRIDAAKNAKALIQLLVKRLRETWPAVPIIVRGGSGFCRQRLTRWCERNGVGYVLGMARNARLEASVSMADLASAERHAASGVKQREIGESTYAADRWDRERRVITRLEYDAQGNNPRFVVTNVQGQASALYDDLYCQRGEAENRIKETQLDLFGTRAIARRFSPTSFAYCWPPWPTC